MSEEYRAHLEAYLASMLQARKMLSAGIITGEDYSTIDNVISEKYGLESCGIYHGIDLIYAEARANMSHYEEVTACQR